MDDSKARKYRELLHAVQSGVAYLEPERYGGPPGTATNEAKHMRVGINSAKVELAGVARLLIQKGVFTEDEYVDAIIAEMQEEVARLEAEAEKKFGSKVTFK